jgi:hypothetical protein
MKYKLFPKLDFLAYVSNIHVAYNPGRAKSEVARRLVLQITSQSVKKKFPALQSSWELLAYDAPSTVDVTFADGNKRRFMADHWSKAEMQAVIDKWQFEAHLEKMKTTNIEKPGEDD